MSKFDESLLVCVLRPDNTALWLPYELARSLQIRHGDRLTKEQFESKPIRDEIAERIKKQTERRKPVPSVQ